MGGLSEGLQVGQWAQEPWGHRWTSATPQAQDWACALLGQDLEGGHNLQGTGRSGPVLFGVPESFPEGVTVD